MNKIPSLHVAAKKKIRKRPSYIKNVCLINFGLLSHYTKDSTHLTSYKRVQNLRSSSYRMIK
jgi:hypothetical protein